MNPTTYGQGDSLGRPWPPEPIVRVSLSCGHIVTVRKGVTETEAVNSALEHDKAMSDADLAAHLRKEHGLVRGATPWGWNSRVGLVSNHSWSHQEGVTEARCVQCGQVREVTKDERSYEGS